MWGYRFMTTSEAFEVYTFGYPLSELLNFISVLLSSKMVGKERH